MSAPTGPGSVEAFSAQDEALLAFGQKAYTGSIDLLRDNAKSMVSVVSGLFAVYFAVLAFLGYKYLPPDTPLRFGIAALVPPVLLVISLLAFAWVSHPVIARTELQDLTVLRQMRDARVIQMARRTQLGMAFFVAGLLAAVLVAVAFLVGAPPQPPP